VIEGCNYGKIDTVALPVGDSCNLSFGYVLDWITGTILKEIII
jgi:hypothetical protein